MPATAPTSPDAFTANLESTFSSRVGNGKGRQLDNVGVNVGQSRPLSTPNAWASGTNPLTRQPSNPTQQRSAFSHVQNTATGGSAELIREGFNVRITLDSGAEFEGTYSCHTDSTYTLKMVQQKKLPASSASNGATKSNKEQPSMSFQKKDVADIHVTSVGLPKRESGRSQNGFRTDTAISGNKVQGERVLQRWMPDSDVQTDMSLESGRGQSSNGASWDQFAVNEKLFGLQTDYDESIYTTAIDRNHPDYQKRRAEADRKAREIEGSATSNIHVAEERVRDNVSTDRSGRDEEDKYSGVDRSSEFPSIGSNDRANKYTPPARRAPTGQATVSGAPVDPAIISSQLARSGEQALEQAKSTQAATAKAGVSTPPTTTHSSFVVTPEPKAAPSNTSAAGSRTASATPNATATVERDVASAFKGFAAQQRRDVDKLRSTKARADKESKLSDLKKFSETFKLNSPVPEDLVAIIAKDPAKQREIQVKSKRNAEQAEQAKHAKTQASKASATPPPASNTKTGQRPTASPRSGSSTSGGPSRQIPNRASAVPPQGPYVSQSSRGDRLSHGQAVPTTRGPPTQGLTAKLRTIEQTKNGGLLAAHPPTGPANANDLNFARRSSGAASALNGKLNPNSNEFRPNASAIPFNPNGDNRSTGSSPRSNSTHTAVITIPSPSGSLLRRRQLVGTKANFDVIEKLSKLQPPPSKDWSKNGGIKPAYDTPPAWKQIDPEKEPADSAQNLTYAKVFENLAYANSSMTTPQHIPGNSQVPHQHQLPFHLQQGAHNPGQRQSPRQPPMHSSNSHHNHGPTTQFNGADEHRMMPSHSAQSFASPRLQQVNMAYPSPMGQPAQLVYNQNGMQFPMGPNTPQMPQYRSYSGGHQFVPQQGSHIGAPVMIQAPAANSFMGGPGMVSPAPQMMYPVGGPHLVPQGPPPAMPGSNGYPSPGRGAPMMMQQGSQQGHQPVYGMSPGMQYGQPIYAQQPPGPMQNMRGYPQGQPQFRTSPQMQQYGQPHRGTPSGSYNKSYQPQHGPHPAGQQIQTPTGHQPRPEGGDEVKIEIEHGKSPLLYVRLSGEHGYDTFRYGWMEGPTAAKRWSVATICFEEDIA
ncbi:MAG: hypothetical protein M1818_005086 [Claussenomyces sp. TS43310]|nr:MAG: hypothetical protein M1818_005086 [Claussenomyces sp. TS43310]